MSRSQGVANPGWPPRHPAGDADPRAQNYQAPQPQQGPRGQPPQYAQPQQPVGGYPQQPQPQGYADPHQGYAAPQPPSYGGGPQGYHYPQQDQQPAQPPQRQHAQSQPPRQQQPPQYAQPQQHAAPRGQQSAPAPRQQAPQYASPQQSQPPVNRQGLSSLESVRQAQQPVHDFNNFPRTQPPRPQPQYAPPREQAPPSGGRGAAAPSHSQGQHQQYGQQSRQAQPPTYNMPSAEAGSGLHAGDSYGQGAEQYGAGLERSAPAPAYQQAPSYDQWPPAKQPQSRPSLDAFGQDHAQNRQLASGYPAVAADFAATAGNDYALGNGAADPYGDPLQNDWGMAAAAGYGDRGGDPQGFDHQGFDQQGYAGYDQQSGGALEPADYNADDLNGYEVEEPRRASWAMRIAGALVVAIGLGYGLAQAYQAVVGGSADNGAPPVIASDDTPAKERPADPGGRQFSHTDSKVLGRLEQIEGGNGLEDSDQGNGTRKVSTLVVGRDGSIMPPSDDAPDAPVSVPGMMVVDAFGTGNSPTAQMPRQPEPARPTVNVKSTRVIPATTASIEEEAPAAPRRRTAAAPPAASSGSSRSASGAKGYVVVLSSVPASGSSRLDALRKFADMQQQHGPVLANKTPDVRETTLAGKGAYHRLLVGPPGSKTQANELCIQLKASGYNDCWVTAY